MKLFVRHQHLLSTNRRLLNLWFDMDARFGPCWNCAVVWFFQLTLPARRLFLTGKIFNYHWKKRVTKKHNLYFLKPSSDWLAKSKIPPVGLVTTPRRPLPRPSKNPETPPEAAPSIGFSNIPVTPFTTPCSIDWLIVIYFQSSHTIHLKWERSNHHKIFLDILQEASARFWIQLTWFLIVFVESESGQAFAERARDLAQSASSSAFIILNQQSIIKLVYVWCIYGERDLKLYAHRVCCRPSSLHQERLLR